MSITMRLRTLLLRRFSGGDIIDTFLDPSVVPESKERMLSSITDSQIDRALVTLMTGYRYDPRQRSLAAGWLLTRTLTGQQLALLGEGTLSLNSQVIDQILCQEHLPLLVRTDLLRRYHLGLPEREEEGAPSYLSEDEYTLMLGLHRRFGTGNNEEYLRFLHRLQGMTPAEQEIFLGLAPQRGHTSWSPQNCVQLENYLQAASSL